LSASQCKPELTHVEKELKKNTSHFDIHMSVHRNTIPNYSQQDATFLDLYIFTDALHVSGGSSAHHQEHVTVHTASGIVNQAATVAPPR